MSADPTMGLIGHAAARRSLGRRAVLRLLGRLQRRLPFSAALVGLVVVLTGLTGVAIGGLAWRANQATARTVLDAAMARTARLAAGQATRFFREAESVARVGPALVAGGLLDPDDSQALQRYTLAVLQAHPNLSWVSYGGRDDRFVGAWRDGRGRVYLNHSFPSDGRIRLEEDEVLADGRRTPVRRIADHGYRPRERPFYQLAVTRRAVVWTLPYDFYAGGGVGVTCAAPLLDGVGQVRGVFTVDFSLDGLGALLEDVVVSPQGRVFLVSGQGIAAVRPHGAAGSNPSPVDLALATHLRDRVGVGAESSFDLWLRSGHFLGRSRPLGFGSGDWRVEVVVPEADYTAGVAAQTRRAAVMGGSGSSPPSGAAW